MLFRSVRATKAGDYYLTLTESKKFTNPDGSFHYKKHKIYLYKEDFESFKETLDEMMSFIIDQKGEEVISERHRSDYQKESNFHNETNDASAENEENDSSSFTDISFEDI